MINNQSTNEFESEFEKKYACCLDGLGQYSDTEDSKNKENEKVYESLDDLLDDLEMQT